MDYKLINKLLDEYGSPLYIFKSNEFIDNYNELLSAFRRIYPKYTIAYSYKTNYTPRICQLVKQLGGYAEVVSDMEYMLAKKIGYSNDMIIYNGPIKGELFEEHLLHGGIANIDNIQEVDRVCELASRYSMKKIEIGIRVNIDVGANFISRFGIQPETHEFKEAIKKLMSYENINIVGLHCHTSRARGLDAWKKRAETMIQLADSYIDGPPKYINLGSGMYGHMDKSLSDQFDGVIPTYSDYAEAVATLFSNRYAGLPEEEMPILFTEPGTTLIAKYIEFLCKVENIRSIRGKYFATLNCSMHNLGEICQMKNLPITVYSNSTSYFDNIDLMGYTCLEQDCVYRGYKGKLAVNDLIVFKNVGGYSNVSKPPFIQPNCPMVEISAENNITLIKKQETYEYIFSTYVF
jgi:diaminopimelate decarboxylase